MTIVPPSTVEMIRAKLARRQELAAELSTLDRELDEIRAALGLPSAVRHDEGLGEAIVNYLQVHGPTPLHRLREETGRSLHKLHAVLKLLGDRVEMIGATNCRMVKLVTDDRPVPPYKPPAKVHKRFTPKGGSAGSRECYENVPGKVKGPPARLPPRQPDTIKRGRPDPPVETVWRPGKDAPSLTGSAPGLGQTLSGSK